MVISLINDTPEKRSNEVVDKNDENILRNFRTKVEGKHKQEIRKFVRPLI